MKKTIISIIFCVFALSLNVAAAEDTYIVKLSDELLELGFLSDSEDKSPSASHGLVEVSKEELQDYLDSGYVEYYEPNYEVELFDAEYSDELYGGQWYHSKIKSSYAWDLSTYGNDVKIGVIDSGCNEHPDIVDNLQSGYDFVNLTKTTTDTVGHGTHVSGIIAAGMNGEGIIGISNKAKIIPLKCFDNGKTAKVLTIYDAIISAVDDYDCDIINMSWGIDSDSETLRKGINYANDNGVLLVAAVGNKGNDVLYYPAAYDCVVGVGAVDKNLSMCDFSQYNESVFVVAPGQNILSLGISSDNYVTMNGTSQSAPMVTSLFAMMLNLDNTITIDEVKTILANCSDDLGETGYDNNFGHGLINIQKVFEYMLQSEEYYMSPISLEDNSAEVLVYNNTSENLECDLIVGLYNDNTFGQCNIIPVALNGQQSLKYILGNPNDYNIVKCFLWSDINSLVPLTECRKYVVN